MSTQRLYPVAELAEIWGTSKEFVYAEIRAGRLPTVQLGRGDRNKFRISEDDADAWVEQRRTVPHQPGRPVRAVTSILANSAATGTRPAS